MPCLEIGQMTCKINCLFFPYHNTGGHFIDWSIRYVSGNLVTDIQHPAAQKNWHQHTAIIAHGYDQFILKVNKINSSENNKFENIYISMLTAPDAIKQLFNIEFEAASVEQREIAKQHAIDDYKKIFNWCQERNIAPVLFDYHIDDHLSIFYNNRWIHDWNNNTYDNIDQYIDQYTKTFFSSTPDFGPDIWDRREKLALILKFTNPIQNLTNLYNDQLPHLYYNTDDVWNNFEPCLEEILTVLEISIDPSKWDQWQEFYKLWRTVHSPMFSRNIDKIVKNIVHNKYMCLKRFKINFIMEVMIQQQLIEKYNLNLKTWGLAKFPDNTQDLHKLLEVNIHAI
jgi:hypothetical protein